MESLNEISKSLISPFLYILFHLASLQNKIITRQLALQLQGRVVYTQASSSVEVAFCECDFRRKQVAQWGRGAS